jgi:arginine N-succinyltransferase
VSFVIRAATPADLQPLYEMAKRTGGGFTNLPPDKATLKAKLELSEAGFAKDEESVGNDLYVFVLENVETKQIRGTCQVFGAVGIERPFYSYLISTLTQKSEELGRIFRNQTLNLTTDLEGSSEVGGLFLHPNERAGGLGLLLARSRYLFIRQHRQRFGDTVLAELRGVMDEGGHSPFWDAIGGRFFGMTFPEADEFNAVHGTQFIADLFPRTPVYVNMLPENARAVLGQPHPSGRAALKMLERENFTWDGYVDIFDGGPTVTARTDQIKTVKDAREVVVADGDAEDGPAMLLSHGLLHEFRCCLGQVQGAGADAVLIDARSRRLLGVETGDTILMAGR